MATQPLSDRVQLVRDSIEAAFGSAADGVNVSEYPGAPSVTVTAEDPSLIPDLRAHAIKNDVPMAVYRQPHHSRNGHQA